MAEGKSVLFPLSGRLEFGLKYPSERLFQEANPLHTRKKLLPRHSLHSTVAVTQVTFPRISLQVSQLLLTGLSPALPRGAALGRGWIQRLHVLRAHWAGSGSLQWHTAPAGIRGASKDLSQGGCAIPQCYPTICGRNAGGEPGDRAGTLGILCSPRSRGRQSWEWALLPLPSTDSYWSLPPCQGRIMSPTPSTLEHRENCVENAINKLQAQGKQHIQHFAYF